MRLAKRLKVVVRHVRVRLSHYHHALHEGHNWAHLAYFGAVFVEGHGVYSTMGGVLLLIGVCTAIATGEGEGEA